MLSETGILFAMFLLEGKVRFFYDSTRLSWISIWQVHQFISQEGGDSEIKPPVLMRGLIHMSPITFGRNLEPIFLGGTL